MLGYFTTRFGIPLAIFATMYVLLRHKTYYIVSAAPSLEQLARLKVQTVGLPVFRHVHSHLKPTTAALQRFGPQATTHLVDLSDDQYAALLCVREQPLALAMQPGYVIPRHAGTILGCGLYTPGRLRSQLPKHNVPSFEDSVKASRFSGFDDLHLFPRTYKPGMPGVNQMHNGRSHQMIVFWSDFRIQRCHQIIQRSGDPARLRDGWNSGQIAR
ncbi:MAG: hypothetical protein AB7N91_06590 [Candidatus Tectimicrobiota bacterium]